MIKDLQCYGSHDCWMSDRFELFLFGAISKYNVPKLLPIDWIPFFRVNQDSSTEPHHNRSIASGTWLHHLTRDEVSINDRHIPLTQKSTHRCLSTCYSSC